MGDVIEILTTATNTVEVEAQGPQGIPGVGVPTGGSTGQVLRKASGADYATEWAAAGSGSGSVTSVALASTDLTISGSPITDSGTITANIAANAVTLEKLQTISSEHLLGRHGNGNGGVQQIGLSTGLAMSGSNVRVATTGITAGTYTKLTIDETGRATAGATATPSDIGAQSIFTAVNIDNLTNPSPYQLTANRAQSVAARTTIDYTIRLPETGHQNGDIVDVKAASLSATKTITIERGVGPSSWTTLGTIHVQGGKLRFIANGTGRGDWEQDLYFTTDGTIGAPASHTHTPSEVGLGNVSNTAQVTSVTGTAPIVSSGGTTPAISVTIGSTANTVCAGDDARLSDSREWSAATIDQAEAEAGTATTRRAFTALRVFQAIAAWWNGSAAKTKLDGIAAGATANSSDATLLNRANHTGTQAAGTITGLAASATTDTTNASNITSGTLATARLSVGTTTGTVAAGDDSRFHTRSHAITSTSDHTATANRVFYSDNSGNIQELALGAANTVLTSNGASSAPSFAAASGGGSGGTKTYAVFSAEHNQPPSTAFATLDTRGTGIAVLDFDAATDENAVFVGIMPEAASLGSGLIVRLHWMATSATSGNVRWGVQFERSNTDLDADSFDTAVEATTATNGTSGIITTTAITVTTIDGITAGDVFRLKVFRNADDATNDTMTGDAELVAVEVRSAA